MQWPYLIWIFNNCRSSNQTSQKNLHNQVKIAHMTNLFDPMTSSNSPALDMLEGALDSEKPSDLEESKGRVLTATSPEHESVTVTVSTVGDDPSVAGSSCLGSQSNHAQRYADPNAIQYQYRPDTNLDENHVHTSANYGNGTHIRVVQVHGDEGEHTLDRVDVPVSENNFVQSSHVAQPTVIQSPFPESPPTQVDGDSGRFAYYSHATTDQGSAGQGESIDPNTAYIVRTVPVSGLTQPSSPIPAGNVIPVTQGTGQFYVMMPQDVLQAGSQRTIAPRSHPTNTKVDSQRTPRDEKRRATHNEVERRRRDKINNWIDKLAKLLPESDQDHSKQGQVDVKSKGGVLGKTVDYIHDLRSANARMADAVKENERLLIDVELMRQQYEEATKEVAMLRTQLQQHGIEPVSTSANSQPH
ncbi:upstream stimulatory factor-like isoform X2 [Xenia sp. Carnegie-2017]|uniref:upstream stimulatory factor-like isoform X2 n=1 Tax=Xenia sp. Carnegie-2017 TaxID=2897299 RepID=UPI001F03429F|nr:upstream stimulatory factor-like isoform X2 [Xenia sp. Carnegie-2017]